ncbi:MAG: hypothetical protein ABIV94_10415 [Acidimicrobiales bacterium]
MSAARWMRSPVVDGAVAFAWVPFVFAARWAAGDTTALLLVINGTFLLSFLHQPLTLPLVYGDPGQRNAHRRLYTWSPLVFAAAIAFGLWVSLALVAVVAGLWNAEHTLMQRYGLTRIYGRKVGQGDGRLDKAMLVSWLVLALVWVAAEPATPDRLVGLRLGQVNDDGVDRLLSLQPWAAALLVPVLVVAAVLALSWLHAEASRLRAGRANPAKWLYVASTAALFTVILVDPVAGFIGYVGAHSIEYFVIVHHALGSRFTDGSGGPLGRVVRAPRGRGRFLGWYVATFLAVVAIEKAWGDQGVYGFTVLFLGGLHVFYDGFVWKLRRPAVARGLVTAD